MSQLKIAILTAGMASLAFTSGLYWGSRLVSNGSVSEYYSANISGRGNFDACSAAVAIKEQSYFPDATKASEKNIRSLGSETSSRDLTSLNDSQARFSLDSEHWIESMQDIFSGDASLEKNLAIGKLQLSLLKRLREEPGFAEEMVDYFNQSVDSDIRMALLDSLAQHSHPAVEELALSLVESDNVQDQERALQMIKDLGVNNQKSFQKVKALIGSEQSNPGILYAALDSLPDVAMGTHEHHALLGQLQALSGHESPEIREKSLIEIAKRAKDIQDLAPVLQALDSGEKEAAAVALYETRVGGEALRNQMFSRMIDDAEPLEVRMVAAETLKRFVLDDHQAEVYGNFTSQHDTRSLFEVNN